MTGSLALSPRDKTFLDNNPRDKHGTHRYTLEMFQQTNRLGCADCYLAFSSSLLPLLSRFHRHPSHLGKRPGQASGLGNQLIEITRTRVALEKAIATENFEEAAKLRDRIRRQENADPDSS